MLLLSLGALGSCTVNYYGLDQNQTAYSRRAPYPSRRPERPVYYPPAGGETGGVRPPATGSGPGGVRTPPSGGQTGGIKPPPPVRVDPVGIKIPTSGGETGGIKPPPTGGETGGIKPPPTGGETGGIKPPPPAGGETGGIKPPPTGAGPTGIRPPVDINPDDVKPPRSRVGSVGITPPPEKETGGIKPPPVEPETGGIKPPPPSGTGGIKPTRGLEAAGGREVADAESQEPVMVFTKTSCLGPCPDFTASIWADGRVTYVGKQNVAKVGTYELRLSAATVSGFLRAAQKIEFRSYKSHYTSGTTDLPSTILTIRQADGHSKTVQVEENAPPALQELFAHINGELDGLVGNTTKAAE
ncbi:hypothetical protein GCM10022408_01570 [Hymenobacter fastidiosus]|uniref:DUF6438 domain-containing protein n=1 Tax=Hymenobacter fastidiosus TaxID=486264 RepID=A0ABP7RCK3_9BACT